MSADLNDLYKIPWSELPHERFQALLAYLEKLERRVDEMEAKEKKCVG